MYAAKSNGKNRIVQFGDELGNAERERLTLESDLRRAITEGEILPYFQPEFDLTTNQLPALKRWPAGPIPPWGWFPRISFPSPKRPASSFPLART